MNLKHLSDEKLLRDTKHHATEEKRHGLLVLHHIREIDARKLFGKHSSLFAYCRDELGYAETTASRRIQAMKLIRDLPEYEKKLEDGLVHESNLCTIQTFFNREEKTQGKAYSKEEKLDVLKEAEGKSARQTEQLLAEISPQSAKKEKVKKINGQQTEIKFTANQAFMEKLEKIRNLLGFQLTDQQYVTLFNKLADIALQKLEKKSPVPPTPKVENLISETRTIPEKVKRAVRARDGERCTHVEHKSGERCQSKFALQFDHTIPFAQGGKSTYRNLTLKCPAHNQRAAILAYGLPKMQNFWVK
jgi:5-methylcytosine-specific restriction endonuclease McrA